MTPSFISAPSSFSLSYFMNELVKFSSSLKCVLQDFTERLSQIHSIFPSILISFFIYLFHFSFTHIDFLFPFSSFLLHFSYIHSIFLSPILISSEYPPRWEEECRRPVSISRAFFCNIRNIYLPTNISSDKYSSSEKYLFGKIFVFQLVQNISFPRNMYSEKYFKLWEIFILRNIYSENIYF